MNMDTPPGRQNYEGLSSTALSLVKTEPIACFDPERPPCTTQPCQTPSASPNITPPPS
ncbi:hypothetical protein CERZMDRAFT_89984 [Cercospora zeae-maydis SCOH1-5]|uniref:Uncharacterized protein n=1 Tax=Cercospora zeae-maydis SCOH1-5 TaxID=717836 RepID=A0A6A6FQV2_9PEZI|nr:hypothetical protein CERZMDRAFT_89984 [Cercospora zeae-maydis SCOH1-5]